MSYEDKSITCLDCGVEFPFTAAEQQKFAELGFTNEPKRCRDCRARRKAQSGGGGGGGSRPQRGPRGGGSGGGGGSRFGGGGSRGGDRPSFEVVCADCGTSTTVPFKPMEGRPVYCRECYRSHRP